MDKIAGKTIRVHFHGIAAGGEAVGRDRHGRVVFAPHGAPGDDADVALTEQHGSFVRGRLAAVSKPSPQRVEPPCPYYSPSPQSCGGCQLQHLSYESQLAAKTQMVRDSLQRLGKLDPEVVRDCVPSPKPFGYRNKATVVLQPQGDGVALGFLARQSHQVVDVAQCPIQEDANNALLLAAREAVTLGLAPPFDPVTNTGVVRRLVLRCAPDGSSLLLAETSANEWPQRKDFARHMSNRVPRLMGVLQQRASRPAKTLWGRDWLEIAVADVRYRFSGGSFFQVNTAALPALVETVLRLAAITPGQQVLDLFSGVGLFALAAARAGANVTAVESHPAAMANARDNALRNDLTVGFKEQEAAVFLRHRLRQTAARPYDVAILDPPREGAVISIRPLAELKPHRIVYVSCDPATLARDAPELGRRGYRLKQVLPLDLFPQTAHVESIALLER